MTEDELFEMELREHLKDLGDICRKLRYCEFSGTWSRDRILRSSYKHENRIEFYSIIKFGKFIS